MGMYAGYYRISDAELEQLRQLLKNIGSHDLADLAVCAAQELQEAVRCIRESARKYENVELEPELTRPEEGSGAVWLAAAAATKSPLQLTAQIQQNAPHLQ